MPTSSRGMMVRLMSCTSVTGTMPGSILVTRLASISGTVMSRP